MAKKKKSLNESFPNVQSLRNHHRQTHLALAAMKLQLAVLVRSLASCHAAEIV